MAESIGELNSGHGAIAGRHMVIISGVISDGSTVMGIEKETRGGAGQLLAELLTSLDAAVDHFGGFSVSYGNAMTRTMTLVGFVGQGGWGDRETTGNPNPLARVRRAWLNGSSVRPMTMRGVEVERLRFGAAF